MQLIVKFSNSNVHCRDWVILRPSWLSDIIKPLFRPGFEDSSSTEDTLKQIGISYQRFDKMKRDMLEEGEYLSTRVFLAQYGIMIVYIGLTFCRNHIARNAQISVVWNCTLRTEIYI